MNAITTRQAWIYGLAALGLALAAPVQAAPGFMDEAFIVAQRDRGDAFRQERRDSPKDEQSAGDKRRASRRAAEHDEPGGYGYGYERRQQQQGLEEDSRPRGRR